MMEESATSNYADRVVIKFTTRMANFKLKSTTNDVPANEKNFLSSN
jgi:hypothetical protein